MTAYAVLSGMTFPLMFEVYKPKERLQAGDKYRTKPEIAAGMMRKLQSMGFRFSLVLADSLYGESGKNFIQVLNELDLKFLVAIRSNHQAWAFSNNRVQYLKWHKIRACIFRFKYRSQIYKGNNLWKAWRA